MNWQYPHGSCAAIFSLGRRHADPMRCLRWEERCGAASFRRAPRSRRWPGRRWPASLASPRSWRTRWWTRGSKKIVSRIGRDSMSGFEWGNFFEFADVLHHSLRHFVMWPVKGNCIYSSVWPKPMQRKWYYNTTHPAPTIYALINGAANTHNLWPFSHQSFSQKWSKAMSTGLNLRMMWSPKPKVHQVHSSLLPLW